MNISETPIFPDGDPVDATHFVGSATLKMLVMPSPELNTGIGNVVFQPGCRNNWHSHKGGQILLCTDGEGYYQEQGKPIQILRKGDVVEIRPNLVHWHGATPDSTFTHIAIGPSALLGAADWLGPVSDAEYYSYKQL